jgi:hypothetical protein
MILDDIPYSRLMEVENKKKKTRNERLLLVIIKHYEHWIRDINEDPSCPICNNNYLNWGKDDPKDD